MSYRLSHQVGRSGTTQNSHCQGDMQCINAYILTNWNSEGCNLRPRDQPCFWSEQGAICQNWCSATEFYSTASGGKLSSRTFNQSLKSMLHHVVISDRPREWHLTLPFLLWSYRELPNKTTGYSPFQLVYAV